MNERANPLLTCVAGPPVYPALGVAARAAEWVERKRDDDAGMMGHGAVLDAER